MNSQAEPLSVRCPRCWSPVTARPDELTVRCPTCGATVDVIASERANKSRSAVPAGEPTSAAEALEAVEVQLAGVRAQMDALRVPPITREVRQQLRPLREQEAALTARRDALRATLDPQAAAAFAAPPRASSVEAKPVAPAPAPSTGSSTSDRSWLRKQAGYTGRIGRLNYVVAILAANALYLFARILNDAARANPSTRAVWMAWTVVGLIAIELWVWSAATIKRYHDRDKSAWWALLILIPIIGQIWQLVELALFSGTQGPNKYGQPG